jgi:phenylacetate-CoA ligase
MTMAMTRPTTELERFRLLAEELPDFERQPRRELLAHQRERLRALLRYATARSPYYSEVLGERARSADVRIEELPTLPKATLMSEFDRVVTDRRLRLATLEAFLAQAEAGVRLLDRYHIFATSGTTGVHGVFVYDHEEFRVWVAACLRGLGRLGVTAGTRLAAIGAPGPLHVTRQLFAAFVAGRSGAPQLSVLTPLDEVVAALNDYQPEAVVTYAGVAGQLAEEQLDGRLQIAPRLVVVSAEVLTEDAERRMEAAWGAPPVNVFAATEAPFMAVSSREHVGLHVNEDLVILEVVDEDGQAAPPGTPGHKVLLTNLVNRTQPLIRYELSDSVTAAEGPDPSGRPYARIARVDGRSDDVLRLAGRDGGLVAVHPHRLRAPFVALPDVRQYQVVHGEQRLRVRVVLRDSAPADISSRIRAALARALEDAGAVVPLIELEPVAQLEREPGEGAKLKLVKSQQ